MEQNENRQRQIVRTGLIGVGTNAAVASAKAIVGAAAGSAAIMLDAVNNLTDALSSIVTIIGIKLANRPADDQHPFGHGRVEYFAAIIVAAIVLVAGSTALVEAVKGILHPETQTYTTLGLIIIGVTIVVKLLLGLYTRRMGKRTKSDSLIASGTDCMFDSIVSTSTLVSAALMLLFGWKLDSWLAAAIAILILKTGIEIILSPINELLGIRADATLTNDIKRSVREIPEVRGAYDVVLHNYGPTQLIGALHVEVADTLSAADLHHLTRRIQQKVRNEFGIFVTVGFYAHNAPGTPAAAEEQRIRDHVMAMDGVLGMHGFYLSAEDRLLSFDVVYSFHLKQPVTLRQNILTWLEADYAGYDITIGLDRNYSE